MFFGEVREESLHCRVKIHRQISSAHRAGGSPAEPLGDALAVECVAVDEYFHRPAIGLDVSSSR